MTCPITGGRPTKMMRPTFDKICAKNRQRADEYDRQSWNQGKLMDVSCCKECGGEIPEELEFFDDKNIHKKKTRRLK